MHLEQLSIRDQKVQDFLWKHLEPCDFRHDYTRLDALKEVERQVLHEECQLWGDMEAQFMFRAVTPNPKVLEPHIMGDGRYLREAIRQGAPIAWGMGIQLLRVWTQHPQLVRIAEKCGFVFEAEHSHMLMAADGELLNVYSLIMPRPQECSTLL